MASTGVILFAEDNGKLRKLYNDALSAAGYNVIAVADGREALKLLSLVDPRLILLDVQMPELNGIEACAKARKICGDEVPIIFLTALDRLDFLHECIAAGGDDYIIKSEGVTAVVERVGRWMRRSAGGRSLAARRRDMLSELIAKVEGKSAPEGASDETDAILREIAMFLCGVRAHAMKEIGTSMKEKQYLFGYVTGVVEYWMETRGASEDRLFDYLQVALRNTGRFAEREIDEFVARFDVLATETEFDLARTSGRRDPAEWDRCHDRKPSADPRADRATIRH
jgi:DNA-binding response OmpR family regulator